MTIVAVDDWMIAVTARPRRKALKTLFVTDSMICLSVPDELSLSPSPISRIPYRNKASPPASVNTLKKSMIVSIISYIGHYSEKNGTIYTLFLETKKPTSNLQEFLSIVNGMSDGKLYEKTSKDLLWLRHEIHINH